MKKVNGKYPDSEVLANALKQLQELCESIQSLIPRRIPFMGAFKVRWESLLVIDLLLKAAVILHKKELTYLDNSLLERIEKKCARLSKDNYNDNISSVREINKIGEIIKEIIVALKISLEKIQ